MVSTTVANNISDERGGGLWLSRSYTITSSTITGNRSTGFSAGGGVVAISDGTIEATIISGNEGDCAGSFTSGGYNLVGDKDGCSTPRSFA